MRLFKVTYFNFLLLLFYYHGILTKSKNTIQFLVSELYMYNLLLSKSPTHIWGVDTKFFQEGGNFIEGKCSDLSNYFSPEQKTWLVRPPFNSILLLQEVQQEAPSSLEQQHFRTRYSTLSPRKLSQQLSNCSIFYFLTFYFLMEKNLMIDHKKESQ